MKTNLVKLMLFLTIFSITTISGCTNIASTDYDRNVNIDIYPNPISSYGDIHLVIKSEIVISLSIADNFGREIIKIVENELKPAGIHSFYLNFSNQPSGVYSCILNTNGKIHIQEFTVIK